MKTINEFDYGEFIREMYLKSTPSIDLKTAKGMIKPGDHKLPLEIYDQMQADWDLNKKGDDLDAKRDDIRTNVFYLVLDKGPQLVQ